MLSASHVVHGGEGGREGRRLSLPSRASCVKRVKEVEVTEEESRYIEFYELATQRKLSLASRGFEVGMRGDRARAREGEGRRVGGG